MTLELFVFPPSPRAFKAMVVANHLGLDWTMRLVDLGGGEQRQPAYIALNPNMRVPALKHGDYVLWESNAICQYLAALAPETGLLPKDDLERIEVTRWQFWDLAHFDPAIVPFMVQNVIKKMFQLGEPDEAALAAAQAPFHRVAKVLNDHLAGRRYVALERLTVADFSLAAGLLYQDTAKLPLDEYPEIRRWQASLTALPAWQKTLSTQRK